MMTISTIEAACTHERSHIVDAQVHGSGYATSESRELFCEVCRLQRWLDIEAALALSQAELGLIPADAARAIARSANVALLDLARVTEGVRTTSHSLVPLLHELARVCGNYASQFIHHGATTQDIQDTDLALTMKRVVESVLASSVQIVERLIALAQRYRTQPMIGRTHARAALPYTLGLKFASWLDEIARHVERLRQAQPRLCVAELHGAVGTMAGFDGKGLALLERFAHRLALGAPLTAWHASRDRVAEFVGLLAGLTGSLARMADELRTLGRPELNEIQDRWIEGVVGSSTMPHKRNPETHEQVVVLARLVRALVPVSLESMILEHERDYRGTRTEWVVVPEASHFAMTALALTLGLLERLEVDREALSACVQAERDRLCTEAFMLALGRFVGKQRAFALLYDVCQRAESEQRALSEVAAQHPVIRELIGEAAMAHIFDPLAYLGESAAMVDNVVAAARHLIEREAWKEAVA